MIVKEIEELEKRIVEIEKDIFILGFDYIIVAGEVMGALNDLYPVSGNQKEQLRRLDATEKILQGLYNGLSKINK